MKHPNTTPATPAAFVPGAGGGFRPGAVAARVVEVPAGLPRSVGPAGPAGRVLPCLVVSKARKTYIRKALAHALNLRTGQLLCLHAPERRGDPWLLDTRPRVGRPYVAHPDGGGYFTRTCEIGTEQLLPGRNQTGQAIPAVLTLALRGEHLPDADSPRGIYVLTPA